MILPEQLQSFAARQVQRPHNPLRLEEARDVTESTRKTFRDPAMPPFQILDLLPEELPNKSETLKLSP